MKQLLQNLETLKSQAAAGLDCTAEYFSGKALQQFNTNFLFTWWFEKHTVIYFRSHIVCERYISVQVIDSIDAAVGKIIAKFIGWQR